MKSEIRWAFAGGKAQGIGVLAALVEAGFVPQLLCASVADELAVLQALSPGSRAAAEPVAEGLDLVLTCRYGLLAPAVFERPRLGAVNLHSSLLPKYRGVHPVSWALVDGEKETGVSLHRIDAGVDTGDLLFQRAVPIEASDDLWSLTAKLDRVSAELAVELFEHMARTGALPASRPQTGPASRARRRLPEDGAFSFAWTSKRIRDLVRALPPPLPVAFAQTGRGKFFASRCEIVEEGRAPVAAPGTLLKETDGFEFTTGDGVVRLEGEWS